MYGFRFTCIDRQTFRASDNSRIAYFELLNPENRPVIQKKILMENGFGPGRNYLTGYTAKREIYNPGLHELDEKFPPGELFHEGYYSL